MNKKEFSSPLEQLNEIRNVMQRSSRIFSLSGWSGVWAGLTAVIGIICTQYYLVSTDSEWRIERALSILPEQRGSLLFIAIIVFMTAVTGAIIFTFLKNRQSGQPAGLNTMARKIIINLSIPIFCGAVFCLKFAQNDLDHYIVPSSLVFYGLALINTSKYTFSDIKYLGLFEILLGLLSMLMMKWHLIFWLVGFGFLHIIYGIVMWIKYERK